MSLTESERLFEVVVQLSALTSTLDYVSMPLRARALTDAIDCVLGVMELLATVCNDDADHDLSTALEGIQGAYSNLSISKLSLIAQAKIPQHATR
jgi:hypothetical protein